MPVSFNQIPANWRLPLYWLEVDPSQAGLPIQKQPALLVGQKFAAGVAAADVPIAIGSLGEAKYQFGEGSMLERMCAAFFRNTFSQELWCVPVVEPVAGAPATGTILVASAPTAAGTLYIYIAGQRISVAVAADDTVGEVATAINAAINALTTLPVTSTVDTATCTLTCRWKGLTGNDIDVRANYLGAYGGEVMPTGLALTISNSGRLSSGTDEPDFSTAIANLGDENYEYVAMPFTDSTSLSAWEAEYGFGDTGRWGWMRQLYGHIFSAYRASYADLLVFGATRNSGITSIMGWELDTPTPVWECAAAYCSKAGRALINDPARPLQTLPLTGILPAPKHQRFDQNELNVLAGTGLATQKVGADGVPMIMRETTTYQKNLYSQSDDAYELVTTLATLAALFRNQRQAITSKFPRHKLADDGTRFGVGQAIVTPKVIKAELVAEYSIDEFNGLVENLSAFKKNLVVERDPNNPNRINVVYPPDLVNQLRIFAVLAQFRLQYDRGVDTTIAA